MELQNTAYNNYSKASTRKM